MRITCDRCGKDRMLNEVHTPERQRAIPIPTSSPGCGGRAGRTELLSGIEATSNRPVRRIVLISGGNCARNGDVLLGVARHECVLVLFHP